MVHGVTFMSCNKEITADNGCFCTGMGVPGQLGKLYSSRCSGLTLDKVLSSPI